jgi:hypothetical protein
MKASANRASNRNAFLSRENILKLLSDEEVSRVSTAETAANLAIGDEYLDLEQLDRGVQQARGPAPAMGRVLPRKAVHASTWSRIVTELRVVHDAPAIAK